MIRLSANDLVAFQNKIRIVSRTWYVRGYNSVSRLRAQAVPPASRSDSRRNDSERHTLHVQTITHSRNSSGISSTGRPLCGASGGAGENVLALQWLGHVGVLRLRSCFASRSGYSTQEDTFVWCVGLPTTNDSRQTATNALLTDDNSRYSIILLAPWEARY
jgi:hypothetical protein